MQTKSNIQLIRESLAVKEAFKNSLNDFMDKYMIEDSYFSISKSGYGKIEENVSGYFVFNKEYNNFDEAIYNMSNDQSIRIIENSRFQIGEIVEKLSETKGERVIDITSGEVI